MGHPGSEKYRTMARTSPATLCGRIPLSLGGYNDATNLWPQSYVTQPWNAHRKDRPEARLHHLVCQRLVPLGQAQREMAEDWIKAYQKYIGDN
jgi:hypothetical protein